MKNDPLKVDLSFASILRFFLVAILIVFFFVIKEILAIIFIAFLFSSGFNPLIEVMARKIPRILAVTIVYLTIVGLFLGLGFLIQNTIAKDVASLTEKIKNGEFNVKVLSLEIPAQKLYLDATNSLKNSNIQTVISGAKTVAYSVTTVLVIFVLTFYMLMEKDGLKNALSNVLPLNIFQRVVHMLGKIEQKVGNWLRGQLILMVIVGALTYIVLKLLGVPYAAVLAVIAGITEIIPGVGPIAGAVVGVIVAIGIFPTEPIRWLLVALAYLFVQQFENQVLVPQVMKKVLGLSPVLILISLLIGAKLWGILGAFLAVPVAASLSVIAQEWEMFIKPNWKKS